MKHRDARQARQAEKAAAAELRDSLSSTKAQLQRAYAAFDYQSDPSLTESCIFEIRALQSRMDYLLRRLKAAEASAAGAAGGREKWV